MVRRARNGVEVGRRGLCSCCMRARVVLYTLYYILCTIYFVLYTSMYYILCSCCMRARVAQRVSCLPSARRMEGKEEGEGREMIAARMKH